MTNTPRKRLPHAERRTEILDASAAMFRTRGYDAASIDAIAASIGISGPAIYRYFARKSEILIALIETASADAIAAIDKAVTVHPGSHILDKLAEALIDHAGQRGDVIAMIQSGAAKLEADDTDRLHRIRRDLVAHLGAALNRARPELVPPEANLHADVALVVVGHMFGRVTQDKKVLARFRAIVRGVLTARVVETEPRQLTNGE